MQNRHYILMADVIGSRQKRPDRVQQELRDLVETVNAGWSARILSPLTITLGDEFQGVVDSLRTGVELIFAFERLNLLQRLPFKLRYVLLHGVIQTPLNPEIAHGMLGEGLTEARDRLSSKRRNRPRFDVRVGDEWQDRLLSDLFSVVDSIAGRWKSRDYGLLHDLITLDSISGIAARQGKDTSQIYRRRRTLQTMEYRTLRELLLEIAKRWEQR